MDDQHLDLLKELLSEFKSNIRKVANTVDTLIEKSHEQDIKIQDIVHTVSNYKTNCPYNENEIESIVEKKIEAMSSKKESLKLNKVTLIFMICSLIIAALSFIFTINVNTSLVKKEGADNKQEQKIEKQELINRSSFDSLATEVKKLQKKKRL